MIERAASFKIALPIVVLILAAAVAGTFWWSDHNRFISEPDKPTNVSIFLPDNFSTSTGPVGFGSYPPLADPDFFGKVFQQFISNHASFVEADLSGMRLTVYKDGLEVVNVPILTKGRVGSWWETPAGIYQIQSKEPSHFSSFGHVYQPWSMAFQGNFFIHGWPVYPDGTPVSSSYSGGCIRLATKDAESIYNLISTGTPVLVRADGFKPDKFTYENLPPEIHADEYLVADLKNGAVLAEKNSKQAIPIASLTKLMTALVGAEYINLDKDLTVPGAAKVFTSKARLIEGAKYRAYDLLFPLLMESSNEAAETLAAALGREKFIQLMNEKAAALGMKNTKFTDPSGSDEGNISSPEDLAALARYLLVNRSFILKISAGQVDNSAYGQTVFKDLGNFNVFNGQKDFLGGKVGETRVARQTILSIFEIHRDGQARPVVVIVLGSDDRVQDATALKKFLEQRFGDEKF